MKEVSENKARRRRSAREAFPFPLNQIPLRHVDTVQSLNGYRREILASALAKVGVTRLAACLMVIKTAGDSIKSESDLLAILHLSEIPDETSSQGIEEVDTDYLASLLIKCYPDMPQATADALVASEVMASSLQVVSTTRLALQEAKSDFVITALYTLFEEKLDEIEKTITNNPTFVKTMQLSRPDWKPT